MSPSIRILVVDDYKDWRDQVRSLLRARPEWQIICEVSGGSEAVQKAEELKPDLILLDIGLPKLNGIEAARRIRQLSPNSKIIFLSMETSPDVVQVALSTGAEGSLPSFLTFRMNEHSGGNLITTGTRFFVRWDTHFWTRL
jgi:DNA-binding NarL/FixJ family response regulator